MSKTFSESRTWYLVETKGICKMFYDHEEEGYGHVSQEQTIDGFLFETLSKRKQPVSYVLHCGLKIKPISDGSESW